MSKYGLFAEVVVAIRCEFCNVLCAIDNRYYNVLLYICIVGINYPANKLYNNILPMAVLTQTFLSFFSLRPAYIVNTHSRNSCWIWYRYELFLHIQWKPAIRCCLDIEWLVRFPKLCRCFCSFYHRSTHVSRNLLKFHIGNWKHWFTFYRWNRLFSCWYWWQQYTAFL